MATGGAGDPAVLGQGPIEEAIAIIYLAGGGLTAAVKGGRGVGIMCQPGNKLHHKIPAFGIFAADNACFAGRWDEETWLAWLDALPREGCLFASAPDVFKDAEATWERSRPYLKLIREMGFPAALVAQDGLLEPPWDAFDCLFLGGSTDFKLSPWALHLAGEARRRGKWSHMGRVSSLVRVQLAALAGCHSVDGTFLRYGPERRLPEVRAWLRWADRYERLARPERSWVGGRVRYVRR